MAAASNRSASAWTTGRWAMIAALLLCAGCMHSDLRPDYPRTPSAALPASHDSPLTGYVGRLTEQHPDQSGMRLISDSTEALLARVALADRAVHSLDVQYYIFQSDATGKLITQKLLAAADRGVRVRLLLDDLHVAGKDATIMALDGHPHIEIRLFNPFLDRGRSMLSIGSQFAGDFSRLDRRMHNKAFIADGAIAVVGGRNIGNDYFDAAHHVNFRDLDLLTIGPVVTQTEQVFDAYWNSTQSYPIGAFHTRPPSATTLAGVRKALNDSARRFSQTDYAHNLIERAGDLRQEEGPDTWAWGSARFLADTPAKGDPKLDAETSSLRLAPEVKAWVDGVQQRLVIISPYFIPGPKGVSYLQNLSKRGVDIDVLTNSLASTDTGSVYEAYASRRPPLLQAGVSIYELKPAADGMPPGGRLGSSGGVSLHAKAMVIDDRRVFVGSMNMDPRSRNLNTEDGVIAESPALAQAVLAMFADASAPASAYRVKLAPDGRGVYWESSENGATVRFDRAPQTTAWRRFKTACIAVLPIEGLL